MIQDRPFEIPYPSSRRLTFDLGRIGRDKHHVKALLEVDLTEARERIKLSRGAGTKISLTAWLIKVIADCVALHPQVAGVNRPRANKVVAFGEVDLSIVIEKDVGGTPVPLPYVIRRADQKTLFQIHDEIEVGRSQVFQDEGDYVLGGSYNPLEMRLFVALPQWLRLALMRMLYFNNPLRLKRAMGTVMVTTVGMAGHTRGWMIPFSMHPLCLAFGSLNRQPWVHGGQIQIREILHLTALIDHDAIDGMPAARFIDDLVRKMELGSGLPAEGTSAGV